MYASNPKWDQIIENNFENLELNNFRSNGPNNHLSTAYEPFSHGVLFFKTILYNMAQSLDKNDIDTLKQIKNRDLGNPLSISYTKDLEVDIDYLQGLNEMKFLNNVLRGITSICEIGAGYGRLAHSILSLYPSVEKYFIFDLKAVLSLSKNFLAKVLPRETYKKIVFLSVEQDSNNFNKISVDLCIGTNVFQEMESKVILNYLDWADKSCQFFYSNSTVGKFQPDLCGFTKDTSTKNALSSGLLTEIINIFNKDELKIARLKFIEAFKPSSNWECVKHATCTPWPHYYQALYHKTNA